jgi:hypothetical protein
VEGRAGDVGAGPVPHGIVDLPDAERMEEVETTQQMRRVEEQAALTTAEIREANGLKLNRRTCNILRIVCM